MKELIERIFIILPSNHSNGMRDLHVNFKHKCMRVMEHEKKFVDFIACNGLVDDLHPLIARSKARKTDDIR